MKRSTLPVSLLLATFVSAFQASANPPPPPGGPAAEARFFLRSATAEAVGDPQIGPAFVPGAALASQQEQNTRAIDIRFPIQWWRWSPVTVSFTPTADGEVELALTSPWGADDSGREIRQEVLWDDIQATGATVENGGFEHMAESHPAAWSSPWSPYPAGTDWPLHQAKPLVGQHCAAAWHGRPLTQTLKVRGGREVRLTLHARAALPKDFHVPARLTANTPAHQTTARLKRGVNLGNCWESNPGEAGVRFTPEDIDRIAAEGFDHIRVPVAWHHHLNGGKTAPELLEQLEPVLRRAIDLDLAVLLVWQNHPDLMKDPDLHSAAFIAGWETIARHFQTWPDALLFNLLNEPSGQLKDSRLNALYQKTVAAIRQSNPRRTLVIEPGQWSTVAGLETLHVPDDDHRLIISIHCYEPFPITHQGAPWVGLESLRGLTFPGPPAQPVKLPASLESNAIVAAWLEDYNRRPAATNPASQAGIEPILARAAAWSKHFGRPIHIGEFGATRQLDPASRAAYARAFRQAAEHHRLPWCWWEWKAGFGYWDSTAHRPLLRDALTR